MKHLALSLLALTFLTLPARGDLTLVQKIEGAGPLTQMTMKIKGDKVRVDPSPEITSIVDSKTGDMLNIMHTQKMVMRVSAEQAKAAMAMAGSSIGVQPGQPAVKPKVTPTGKKEKIDGHDAEEYITETPTFKASYWVAKSYPKSDEIMNQLRATTPQAWGAGAMGMPDFRDFPGLPIRTNVTMGGQQFVSTIVSVKQDPLPDSEFAIPTGYQEMKMPDMSTVTGGPAPVASPATSPKK